jgi:hypothetical protein
MPKRATKTRQTAKAMQTMASAVETSSRNAKRARAEDADPPDTLSATPVVVHTNNWSVRIFLC